jgi:hypothetical protein
MLAEVKKQAPSIFALAGPPCLSGTCPEGKLSCGKMDEMRRLTAVTKRKRLSMTYVFKGLDAAENRLKPIVNEQTEKNNRKDG